MIGNEVTDNCCMAHIIWSRLDRGRTAKLHKLQISMLSTVTADLMGYCIMDVQAKCIDLGQTISIEATDMSRRKKLFFIYLEHARHNVKEERDNLMASVLMI